MSHQSLCLPAPSSPATLPPSPAPPFPIPAAPLARAAPLLSLGLCPYPVLLLLLALALLCCRLFLMAPPSVGQVRLGTGDPCLLHATESRACLLRSVIQLLSSSSSPSAVVHFPLTSCSSVPSTKYHRDQTEDSLQRIPEATGSANAQTLCAARGFCSGYSELQPTSFRTSDERRM